MQTVQIVDDVSYKRNMTYRAVPVAALLPGIQPENHLQAVALDGFAAELTAAPLLSKSGARAWLAVEDEALGCVAAGVGPRGRWGKHGGGLAVEAGEVEAVAWWEGLKGQVQAGRGLGNGGAGHGAGAVDNK